MPGDYHIVNSELPDAPHGRFCVISALGRGLDRPLARARPPRCWEGLSSSLQCYASDGAAAMSTFVLIHGAGDVGWYWHLVEAELRARGHDVVAPDLPGDDDSLELEDYADAVVAAIGGRTDLVVVGHSFGGFPAPLVAARLPVDALVFVAGMVPASGEAPGDWWERTGYRQAVAEQAAHDGGATGSDDPYVRFYHDVPQELATLAMSKARAHP